MLAVPEPESVFGLIAPHVSPASCRPPDPVDPLWTVTVIEVNERLYEVQCRCCVSCAPAHYCIRRRTATRIAQRVCATLSVESWPARRLNACNDCLVIALCN